MKRRAELPTHLEHGPDVIQVSGTRKRSLCVAYGLHKRFGCFSHLFHLQVVQQPPLLLIRYT